jgi:hypothetical protein
VVDCFINFLLQESLRLGLGLEDFHLRLDHHGVSLSLILDDVRYDIGHMDERLYIGAVGAILIIELADHAVSPAEELAVLVGQGVPFLASLTALHQIFIINANEFIIQDKYRPSLVTIVVFNYCKLLVLQPSVAAAEQVGRLAGSLIELNCFCLGLRLGLRDKLF